MASFQPSTPSCSNICDRAFPRTVWLDEGDDQRDDEAVDRDRLGQTEADDHRRPDGVLRLRVTANRLERSAHADADSDGRTDTTERDRHRGGDAPDCLQL